MTKAIPIQKIDGVELLSTDTVGVCRVHAYDASASKALPWDRYVRLKAAADAIRKLVSTETSILDVGGYDGALALFLPEFQLDLIDPATTGASLLHEPVADQSYEIVAAIDVLEHIVPSERKRALKELVRVARKYIVLNYPCQQTKEAQELVLKATNNALVREHVQWELPNTEWVLSCLLGYGFAGKALSHSSLAVWLGQYLTLNLAPESAKDLNRYLIEHHADEPFTTPLYHLLVFEKSKSCC